MAGSTNRRLRILFEQLRHNSSDDIAYEDMQRILPPDPNFEPYSKDQIWAWMHGAETGDLEDRLNYFGGKFVQEYEVDGNYFSVRMSLPGDHNILSLLTTEEGQEARLEKVQAVIKRRNATGRSGGGSGQPKLLGIKPHNKFSDKGFEEIDLGRHYMNEDDYEDVEYGQDVYYDDDDEEDDD
jgi:hypothetical protein